MKLAAWMMALTGMIGLCNAWSMRHYHEHIAIDASMTLLTALWILVLTSIATSKRPWAARATACFLIPLVLWMQLWRVL